VRARPVRVVIDLPAAEPPPPVRTTAKRPDRAARAGSPMSREKPLKPADGPPGGRRPGTEVARNREILRHRFRILLLVVVLLAMVGGVYQAVGRYGSWRGAPFGLGLPTEIEVITPALRVRYGPSMQDRTMGVVLKGTRHRVITSTEQRWMQIEVSQWDESTPRDQSEAMGQGWIYAHPDYIKIVSRRFW
jgi:hypothetical protein